MTRPGQGQPCPPSLREQLRRQQPPAVHVACPHCGAPEGQPCKGPSGRRLRQAHASRFEAAGLRPEIVADEQLREAS
jgi:hypothetical protein